MILGPANNTVLVSRDGTRRPIEETAAPIKNEDGTQGVVLVFRDSSDAREAATRIQESEERYRSLVAATTHTVWTMSPDFSVSVTLDGQRLIGRTDEMR